MSASDEKKKASSRSAKSTASKKGSKASSAGRGAVGQKGGKVAKGAGGGDKKASSSRSAEAAAIERELAPNLATREPDMAEDFDRAAWADESVEMDSGFDSEIDPLADFFVSEEEMKRMGPVGLVTALSQEEAWGREFSSLAEDYLSFFLTDEEYAVPITALREIVRPLPITEVPRTVPYVLGVITLRGTVLPVLDLRIRLGLGAYEKTRAARILVIETEEGPAGIWVDRVSEVVRIGGEPLEQPPGALGAGGEFLEGIIRREGRMLIVLNINAALRVDSHDGAWRDRQSVS